MGKIRAQHDIAASMRRRPCKWRTFRQAHFHPALQASAPQHHKSRLASPLQRVPAVFGQAVPAQQRQPPQRAAAGSCARLLGSSGDRARARLCHPADAFEIRGQCDRGSKGVRWCVTAAAAPTLHPTQRPAMPCLCQRQGRQECAALLAVAAHKFVPRRAGQLAHSADPKVRADGLAKLAPARELYSMKRSVRPTVLIPRPLDTASQN